MYRVFQHIVAGLWALIVVFATLVLIAICVGQSFDGIEGWWQAMPVVGEFTIFLAVGTGSYRYALRSLARQAPGRAS